MSTSENLKVGSVVRLKTGGPAMTVSEASDPRTGRDDVALCKWFVHVAPMNSTNVQAAASLGYAMATREWDGPFEAYFGHDSLDIVEAGRADAAQAVS
jgi:uncharacterized protein YodC (DUF2158 family)